MFNFPGIVLWLEEEYRRNDDHELATPGFGFAYLKTLLSISGTAGINDHHDFHPVTRFEKHSMSGKNPRDTPSPSPASPPPTQSQPSQNDKHSKLPNFFKKQGANRDRSKSITDPVRSTSASSIASGSDSITSSTSDITGNAKSGRRGSKFLIMRDKDKDKEAKSRKSSETSNSPSPSPTPVPTVAPPPAHGPEASQASQNTVDEPPVIVEPVPIPRPRRSADRSSESGHSGDNNHRFSLYSSNSSSKIGDLPSRLSGWFSHTFSTSTTDLSLPNILAQSAQSSPVKSKHPNPLLTAARHGKGRLGDAMRYILDSDSTPDKCTDPIWFMGVQHPGYEPPPPPPAMSHSVSTNTYPTTGRRNSLSIRPGSQTSSQTYLPSTASASAGPGGLQGDPKQLNPGAFWPPVFYADFTSTIWLTYRSQFTPIRDIRLCDLQPGDGGSVSDTGSSPTSRKWWGGEKGWTSDSGWGCMLRTGQSLLANALIHIHLGRDWRRPPQPVSTADYATYVQILTWFFDTPAPEAPFSVHRMALAGKELGKDVGQWFGPSTAAGAIKTLVSSFPEAGLGVSVATDSSVYQTDVFAASHSESVPGVAHRSPRKHQKKMTASWGDRPVLVLIGVRLGIDGVNPIYYETVKMLYTFPQSVGIAGGRPSSSYYFVGSQADNLFYLDPHHARPAIPLRPPPPSSTTSASASNTSNSSPSTSPPENESALATRRNKNRSPPPGAYHGHQRNPTSPSSIRTGASSSTTFSSYHAPLSPSPLQKQFSSSSGGSSEVGSSSSAGDGGHGPIPGPNFQGQGAQRPEHTRPSSPPSRRPSQHARWQSASQTYHSSESGVGLGLALGGTEGVGRGGLDKVQEHYVNAYSATELKTFHCEKVRKMHLSGLDPSMLIGFLVRDESDWWDFKRRVAELPKHPFSVQDEPPTWPSDSDDNMGLESICEPDDIDMDMSDSDDEDNDGEEDGGDGESERFFDTRSASASISSNSANGGRGGRGGRQSEEVDTEDSEDPVDPITPGPNSRFSLEGMPGGFEGAAGKKVVKAAAGGDFDDADGGGEGDIEDDWVDSGIPSPSPSAPSAISLPSSRTPSEGGPNTPTPQASQTQTPHSSSRQASTSSSGSTKKTKKRKGEGREREIPVPVPIVTVPSTSSSYPFPVSQRAEGDSPGGPLGGRSRESSMTMSKGMIGGGAGAGSGIEKRMHNARARDGGRTQSGGVKGIIQDD